MRFNTRKKIIFLTSTLFFVAVFFLFKTGTIVHAQADLGLSSVGGVTGLGVEDIRITIAKIIRIALGFLGILALGIMLYGGFVYMTAGGAEDKVSTAKKIIINGTIGLALILSSFSITQFILGRLTEATNFTLADLPVGCRDTVFYNTHAECRGGGGGFGNTCDSALAEEFFVRSITPSTPAPGASTGMNNFAIRVIFSHEAAAAAGNIFTVTRDGTDETSNFTYTFVDGRSFVVNAAYNAGSAPAGTYTVSVRDGMVDGAGLPLIIDATCGTFPRTAQFRVLGTELVSDTQDPVMGPILYNNASFAPSTALPRGQGYYITSAVSDTSGIGYVHMRIQKRNATAPNAAIGDAFDFYTGPGVDRGSSAAVGSEYVFSYPWYIPADAEMYNENVHSYYEVTLTVSDIDNNDVTQVSRFIIVDSSCSLGSGIGSAPGCRGNGACLNNYECVSGICVLAQCVEVPVITAVNPWNGASGSWVTIAGQNFGNTEGQVMFGLNTDPALDVNGNIVIETWIAAQMAQCASGDMWNDNFIVAEVPSIAAGLIDGSLSAIRVEHDSYNTGAFADFYDTTVNNRGAVPGGEFAGWFTKNDSARRPGLCSITPGEGLPETNFTVQGQDLYRDAVSARILYVGGIQAPIRGTWPASGTQVDATIPQNMQSGWVAVTAQVAGEYSNGLPYRITSASELVAPIIESITPSSVTRGSYVTVSGSRLGDNPGSVYLARTAGATCPSTDCIALITQLPQACGDTWNNRQIIVQVPVDAPDAFLAANVIIVENQARLRSVPGASDRLTLRTGDPLPSICALSPSKGMAPLHQDDRAGLTITGVNLNDPTSATRPTIYFWGINSAPGVNTDWLSSVPAAGDIANLGEGLQTITTRIPSRRESNNTTYSMQTGPIKIASATDQTESNSMIYTVDKCTEIPQTRWPAGVRCCTEGPDVGLFIDSGSACRGEVRTGGYVWRFTTGVIPNIPRVLEECNDASAIMPSPTPWVSHTNGNNVCVNRTVSVRFSMDIDPASFATTTIPNSTTIVPQVRFSSCGTGTEINCAGASKVAVTGFNLQPAQDYIGDALTIWPPYSGTSRPELALSPNTWYLVELLNGILAEQVPGSSRVPLLRSRVCGSDTAYCFYFKTGPASNRCTLTDVAVNPPTYGVEELGPVKKRNGQPLDYMVWGRGNQACSMISIEGTSWPWVWRGNVNEATYVSITGNASRRIIANADALQSSAPASVEIGANVRNTDTQIDYHATSTLSITLGRPRVVDFWPKCSEACLNAALGARFSRNMDARTFSANYHVYRCASEDACITALSGFPGNVNATSGLIVATGVTDITSTFAITFPSVLTGTAAMSNEIRINPATLASLANNTVYLVHMGNGMRAVNRLVGGVMDGEGLQLEPKAWRFRTKDTGTLCTPDRVVILPDPYTAYTVDEKTRYSSIPYSASDSCSPTGQELNPWGFGWSWTKTEDIAGAEYSADPLKVAKISNFKSVSAMKPYCNYGCLATGSDVARNSYTTGNEPKLCGNGTVDPGEDCDIAIAGQTAGTICAYNCLNVGVSGGTCGDGDIDPGEDCDTGNASDTRVGCSPTCLHLGSSATSEGFAEGSPVCGDGSKTVGEDCDPSDPRFSGEIAGVTCSSNCLHIGTGLSQNWCDVNRTVVGSANACKSAVSVCGNDLLERGEECEIRITANNSTLDDVRYLIIAGSGAVGSGQAINTPRSSCTDRCLLRDICSTEAGLVSAGFQCNPFAEGCNSDCTLSGSSVTEYQTASLCGDGVVGTGEYGACEYTSAELTAIEPGWTDAAFRSNPVQLVTSVGNKPLDAGTQRQSTKIRSTVESIRTYGGTPISLTRTVGTVSIVDSRSADGNYYLQCGFAELDAPTRVTVGTVTYWEYNTCKDTYNDKGVGRNSCCSSRPTRQTSYPADAQGVGVGSAAVCRNAAVSVTFNADIDPSTIDANNLVLARGYRDVEINPPVIDWTTRRLGEIDTNGSSGRVFVQANYAYVADYSGGMKIFNILNSRTPTLTGTYSDAETIYDVKVVGDFAYLANGFHGLQVVDVSNKSNLPANAPSAWGLNSDFAYKVDVQGNYAYLAYGINGLVIVDVSNPRTPTFVSSYNTPGWSIGIAVSGNYAYLSDQSTNICPQNGTFEDTDNNGLDDNCVWVNAGLNEQAINIIDISNPKQPVLVGKYTNVVYPVDIQISGDYAYVADFGGGLKILNISSPSTPTFVKLYPAGGFPVSDVQISGHYAYLANDTSGMRILNILNPATPTFVGVYDTPGEAMGIFKSGDNAFVADGTRGLHIVDVSGLPVAPCDNAISADLTPIISRTIVYNHDSSATGENAGGIWNNLARGVKRIFNWFAEKVKATTVRNASDGMNNIHVWCNTGITNTPELIKTQDAAGKPLTKINLPLNKLLDANSTYAIFMRGGKNGIKDIGGVGIRGKDLRDSLDDTVVFRTGDEVCKIKSIGVTPPEFTFTSPNQDDMDATTPATVPIFTTTVSSTNDQIIAPIANIYAWTWTWTPTLSDPLYNISAPNNALAVPDPAVGVAKISSKTIEGARTVKAHAKVTADVDTITSHLGQVFSGATELNSVFCEKPWPPINEYPYEDEDGNDDLTVNGLFTLTGDEMPGVGATASTYFNFRMSYCSDAGEQNNVTDDLPFLRPFVFSVGLPDSTMMKRFIFFNDFNDDAIGIQVFSNAARDTLDLWFERKFGNPTGFRPIKIGGYDGLTDGNNYYVDALNESTGRAIYNNVYLFTINADAQANTRAVFDALIQSLEFNINLGNNEYCTNLPSKSCSSDFDCLNALGVPLTGTTGVCDAAQTKMRRDWVRLATINESQSKLTAMGTNVPTVAAGSYLPGKTYSVWPSWGSVGSAIGGLGMDPLNKWTSCNYCFDRTAGVNAEVRTVANGPLVLCSTSDDCRAATGADPTHTYDCIPVDSQTCWDQTNSRFICPAKMSIFSYTKANAPTNYMFGGSLEYFTSTGGFDLSSVLDSAHFTQGAICAPGQISEPTAGLCGNGVRNSGEACDPPGSRYVTENYCTITAGSGRFMHTCSADCLTEPQVCEVMFECGNGRIDNTETCDEGRALNGTYGHCNANCNGLSTQYCGNNQIDPPGATTPKFEYCDRGVNNGVYVAACDAPGQCCSENCQSLGPRCGDGIVQTGTGILETCDDGNVVDGDGCSRVCVIEVSANCGNGTLNTGEECDDGNTLNGDNCSSLCKITGTTNIVCGNGVVESGEVCDTGEDSVRGNGIACVPAYGESCNYCSSDCSEVLYVEPLAYCGSQELEVLGTNTNGTPRYEACEYIPRSCDSTGQICDEGPFILNRPQNTTSPYIADADRRVKVEGCSRNDVWYPAPRSFLEVYNGSYSCRSQCTRFENTCQVCGHQLPSSGGVLPRVTLLNPMLGPTNGKGVTASSWETSIFAKFYIKAGVCANNPLTFCKDNLDCGGAVCQKDRVYRVGAPRLAHRITNGDIVSPQDIFSGNYTADVNRGIVSRVTCDGVYYMCFSQNAAGNCFEENITSEFLLPYHVNNQIATIDNEYILSPAVPNGTLRVVAHWESEDQSLLSNGKFALNIINSTVEDLYSTRAIAATSGLCNEARLDGGYWQPATPCITNVKRGPFLAGASVGVYMHDVGNANEELYEQSMTIKLAATWPAVADIQTQTMMGRAPYGVYVVAIGGGAGDLPMYNFVNTNLVVDVYEYRNGGAADEKIYGPSRTYRIRNAIRSSNPSSRYWHVFNIVKKLDTGGNFVAPYYDIVTINQIVTDAVVLRASLNRPVGVCGNHLWDSGEICDQSFGVAHANCLPDCSGWSTVGTGGGTNLCGNGVIDSRERCDHGSTGTTHNGTPGYCVAETCDEIQPVGATAIAIPANPGMLLQFFGDTRIEFHVELLHRLTYMLSAPEREDFVRRVIRPLQSAQNTLVSNSFMDAYVSIPILLRPNVSWLIGALDPVVTCAKAGFCAGP